MSENEENAVRAALATFYAICDAGMTEPERFRRRILIADGLSKVYLPDGFADLDYSSDTQKVLRPIYAIAKPGTVEAKMLIRELIQLVSDEVEVATRARRESRELH